MQSGHKPPICEKSCAISSKYYKMRYCCTVVPQYPKGIGFRTTTGAKICRCSSPSYKMVWHSKPSLLVGSTSSDTKSWSYWEKVKTTITTTRVRRRSRNQNSNCVSYWVGGAFCHGSIQVKYVTGRGNSQCKDPGVRVLWPDQEPSGGLEQRSEDYAICLGRLVWYHPELAN